MCPTLLARLYWLQLAFHLSKWPILEESPVQIHNSKTTICSQEELNGRLYFSQNGVSCEIPAFAAKNWHRASKQTNKIPTKVRLEITHSHISYSESIFKATMSSMCDTISLSFFLFFFSVFFHFFFFLSPFSFSLYFSHSFFFLFFLFCRTERVSMTQKRNWGTCLYHALVRILQNREMWTAQPTCRQQSSHPLTKLSINLGHLQCDNCQHHNRTAQNLLPVLHCNPWRVSCPIYYNCRDLYVLLLPLSEG